MSQDARLLSYEFMGSGSKSPRLEHVGHARELGSRFSHLLSAPKLLRVCRSLMQLRRCLGPES